MQGGSNFWNHYFVCVASYTDNHLTLYNLMRVASGARRAAAIRLADLYLPSKAQSRKPNELVAWAQRHYMAYLQATLGTLENIKCENVWPYGLQLQDVAALSSVIVELAEKMDFKTLASIQFSCIEDPRDVAQLDNQRRRTLAAMHRAEWCASHKK